jgi:tetratricopeptide (TPR) repeat protein
MMTTCDQVTDELALLVDGDPQAIARHADHLATCDACRDARHDATELARAVAGAGADYVPAPGLEARLLAAVEAEVSSPQSPVSNVLPVESAGVDVSKPTASPLGDRRLETGDRSRRRVRILAAVGAATALAAGAAIVLRGGAHSSSVSSTSPGRVFAISRAAHDKVSGVEIADHGGWKPIGKDDVIPAGAEIRTDERTRVSLTLADGTQVVMDHATRVAFDAAEPRHMTVGTGRVLADVAHVEGRPATVTTQAGSIDVVGTRFVVTATETFTSVQVQRGAVRLHAGSMTDDVRAGEEGTAEGGKVTVNPVPSLAHETEWAELGVPAQPDAAMSGLGALRAYKPGESRDRDWNLALAKHDVKVRIVGPIARTEITETFRNDAANELEGVYQFPLPVDAQIDSLALDVDGGFVEGAFVDKERGAKIWRGVIDKATPKIKQNDPLEIIWVDGSWRDPALLDWKRGGRFELRVFPIPAKGARTIKLAYTQVVTPRGGWRQYVYPLPHSADGSTVADQFSVDVEVRDAAKGTVRAAGYDLTADPARGTVTALTLAQTGFVPRGDLVVTYHPDHDSELRAWTFAGNAAVAPDDKLSQKQNVGIDPAVVAEQRAVAADSRPTAVLALRPQLPRWTTTKPHDYMIVLDDSQSMVGERFTRATELASALVQQMDRRDRFSVMACDADCRSLGDLREPSVQSAAEAAKWLGAQPAAGASDVVTAIRTARDALTSSDRERWVLYVGDGFATTGFRRVADVERALAGSSVHVTTIGIGSDADEAVLAAAARGAGGTYFAWLPGEKTGTAALAALESTYGSALSDVKLELPAGLADVAPAQLPTIRAGEEVLVAARMTGAVDGEVVLRGTVAGQPFEQRYPLHVAAASSAAGNSFVSRLWASLAIAERERAGTGDDRAKIVALSQAYGVMSRDTSLLVLESPAMFDAFGVDRRVPESKWTGEDAIDEVASNGTQRAHLNIPGGKLDLSAADDAGRGASAKSDIMSTSTAAPVPAPAQRTPPRLNGGFGGMRDGNGRVNPYGDYYGHFAMRRTWVRVPSVSAYDKVNPSIAKAVADAERALQQQPDSRERHRALVQALSYAGELDRARDVAAKWLDRDRLDPQALGYQADLLGRGGQRDLALRTLAGLVDLDADRPALHERMVLAYEQIGRNGLACNHRIALAAIAPKDAKAAGAALRCLRALGRTGDAELVLRALPDDAARSQAEVAAAADMPAPKLTGDLVVDAHWDHGTDLDVSLITPEGARVSWMGGKTDAIATDTASSEREKLVVKSLKKGNYLVEISRITSGTSTVRGTLDIEVLGQKKSLPFELTGSHATVGRISVALQESVQQIDTMPGKLTMGTVSDPELRRVLLARSPSVRACYLDALQVDPSLRGKIVLTIRTHANYGGVELSSQQPHALDGVAQCAIAALASMHTASGSATYRVALVFSP